MTQEEYDNHPGWYWCTAEGAREQVLMLGLTTTFREKLQWLEEAETLALQMRAHQSPALQAAIAAARDQRSTPPQ